MAEIPVRGKDGKSTPENLLGPVRGASDILAVVDTAGTTAPPDSMLNAWPFDPTERRQRIGQRPGLSGVFTRPDGTPWRAPSYIQGMHQVNIASQTRLESGGDTFDIFTDPGGGGDSHQGSAPDRLATFINNLDYQGTRSVPPPTMGSLDYDDDVPTEFGVFQGEGPDGIPTKVQSRVIRSDKFSHLNTATETYGKDQAFAGFNYFVTRADGPGLTVDRCRIVTIRRNTTTNQFDWVNEFEISDGPDPVRINEPQNGLISFHVPGDADAPWHVVLEDLDAGPSFVYVALWTYQTSDGNRFQAGVNQITKHRGWALAIARSNFAPGVVPISTPAQMQHVDGWAKRVTAVRYRPAFTPVTGSDGTVYGENPDVLVCFQGYFDFQSGIARYDSGLATRQRFGEKPWWGNPGHGALSAAGLAGISGDPSVDLIDGDHGYMRFAAISIRQRASLAVGDRDTANDMTKRWTHGCFPRAMDVNPNNGRVYVARTAVGFGVPNPNGTATGYLATEYSEKNLPTEDVPQTSVMAINASGGIVWEADTRTYIPSQGYGIGSAGPFFNDRFQPTLRAIVADRQGGCLVVGRWANGKNVWHCSQATERLGAVDWVRRIGVNRLDSGSPAAIQAKDDTGATTRVDQFGETIGIAELMMLSCDYDPSSGEYAVTGENFPTSQLRVDQADFDSSNPPTGQWALLKDGEFGAVTTAFNTVSKAVIWKLSGSGGMVWRRRLGSGIIVNDGKAVALHRPVGATDNGSWVMFLHARLSGTTATPGAGWTWKSSDRYWWLRNEPVATRMAVVFDRTLKDTEEFEVRSRRRKHEVKALVKCSPDGQDGWEVGVLNNAGTFEFIIRKVDDGVQQPSAATADLASLGLDDDNQAFNIRVRVVNGTMIEGYVSTQEDPDTPAVTFTIDDYFQFDRVGFVSEVETNADGSTPDEPGSPEIVRVIGALISTLVVVEISASRILCIFSNGDLFVMRTGDVVERVAGLNMNPGGLIRAAQFHQKLYIVDGTHARVFDPVEDPDNSISDWVPSSGSLPGDTGAGTTTARFIVNHLDRLFLGGMEDDPNNIAFSAIGNALDWNPNSQVLFGRSSTLANEIAGVAGVPITSLHPYEDDRMIVGGEGRIDALFGDPEFESARLDNVTREAGISGPEALSYTDGGGSYMTTEQGQAVINGSNIQFFSQAILNKFAVPSTHPGTVHPIVIRDGNRYGVFFGFTRVAAEDFTPNDSGYYRQTTLADGTELVSTHLWWDERSGGSGGFFPLRFPKEADPIVAFKFIERVLFGCRDGYIREFDDGRVNDFLSPTSVAAITTFFPTALVLASKKRDQKRLEETFIIATSETTGGTVYGKTGFTPEAVYDRPPADGDFSFPLSAGRVLSRQRLVGPSLLLMFHDSGANTGFAVERVEATLKDAGQFRLPAIEIRPTIPPDDNRESSCSPDPQGEATIAAWFIAMAIGEDPGGLGDFTPDSFSTGGGGDQPEPVPPDIITSLIVTGSGDTITGGEIDGGVDKGFIATGGGSPDGFPSGTFGF